jgi:hypothetical protein
MRKFMANRLRTAPAPALRKPRFRLRSWRLAAAGLATAATVAATATLATTELHAHTAAHAGTAKIALAGSATSIDGQTSTFCPTGSSLPVLVPGITGSVLTSPGKCSGSNNLFPQDTSGQNQQGQGQEQGQDCQLTEAQQRELIARAQDQQAAADQRFQSALLKNLLDQAAAKAGSAALSSQLSGKTGLSPQDIADLIKNGTVTPADMAAAILQTLQELGEDTGGVITASTCTGNDEQNSQNRNYNASSSDSGSSGSSTDDGSQSSNNQGAPADLGPDWVPQDPKTICKSTGCEDVAIDIQKKIGGTRYRIEDQYGAPTLGKYRGEDTYWNYHEVVINNGRVYDAWTPRTGEPLDTYLGQWQYGKYLTLTSIG